MTKQALIAGAFLTAASVAGTATAGAPVIYGKANVSLNANSNDVAGQEDNFVVNSNASRFGLKGQHKLEGVLTAYYKAEYQISIDGDDDEFSQRNIYAGIKGGFGSVKVGMFDTPMKKAQGKIDLFNDLYLGDIKNVVDADFDTEEREASQIQYSSPKIADAVTINVALLPGEGTGSDDSGIADATSVSVVYKKDGIFAAIANDNEVEGVDRKATRFVVEAKVGDGKVGALYQVKDNAGADSDAFVLSYAHKVGKNTYKVQYGQEQEDVGDLKSTLLSVGVDHKLSKKVKVYGYYSTHDNEDGVNDTSGVVDDKQSTLALGMELKF
jgi:predicted porin